MEQKKMSVIKATLSTGKVVLLKEIKISDSENAIKQVSSQSGGDTNVLGMLSQKALLQRLLVKVDDKSPTMAEKDDIDSLFTVPEYSQLMKVLQKISGGDEAEKEAKIEMVADS